MTGITQNTFAASAFATLAFFEAGETIKAFVGSEALTKAACTTMPAVCSGARHFLTGSAGGNLPTLGLVGTVAFTGLALSYAKKSSNENSKTINLAEWFDSFTEKSPWRQKNALNDMTPEGRTLLEKHRRQGPTQSAKPSTCFSTCKKGAVAVAVLGAALIAGITGSPRLGAISGFSLAVAFSK